MVKTLNKFIGYLNERLPQSGLVFIFKPIYSVKFVCFQEPLFLHLVLIVYFIFLWELGTSICTYSHISSHYCIGTDRQFRGFILCLYSVLYTKQFIKNYFTSKSIMSILWSRVLFLVRWNATEVSHHIKWQKGFQFTHHVQSFGTASTAALHSGTFLVATEVIGS